MKNEEEDKKWIEEYPMLKQVNPVHGFGVPSGYFGEMEEQVMSAIRLEKLKQVSANEGFSVPTNYFEELSQNITSCIAIEQVLDRKESFNVPENYFDDLAGNIQSRIAVEELLSTENTFTVPEGYFEGLSNNIQARIAVEEALNADNAFTVPANYFADLENRILAQTISTEAKQSDKEQRQGIIVKFLVSKAFKYASAACFALVVGSAVYISEFNNPVATHNRSYVHKVISKIPNDELEMYLQLNSDNADIATNDAVDNTDSNSKEKDN